MIEKKYENKEKIIFLIEGEEYFVNALRRAVYDIPILAIDEVEFFKNDSALYDEILAHRLGLLPLKAKKEFVLPSECSCRDKNCTKCTAKISLKAKGPGMVYSSQLNCQGCEIIYKEMPIVYLEKGQELEFVAYARLGFGRDHVKHVPGFVFFRHTPFVEAKTEVLKEIVCPKKALKEEKGKVSVDGLKCDLCEYCIEQARKKKLEFKFFTKPDQFLFFIESFGQLSPREIFIEAIENLNKNLDVLRKKLK